MTKDQAIALRDGILDLPWSCITNQRFARFTDAFTALEKFIKDGSAAPAPQWVALSATLTLDGQECAAIMAQLRPWCDGETLLSAATHDKCKRVIQALEHKSLWAQQEFAAGLIVAKVRK